MPFSSETVASTLVRSKRDRSSETHWRTAPPFTFTVSATSVRVADARALATASAAYAVANLVGSSSSRLRSTTTASGCANAC